MKNKISISEYARSCGVSRAAIHKAIKENKIVKGWDEKSKKIIPEEADKEYGLKVRSKKINKKIKENLVLSQKDIEAIRNLPVTEMTINPSDTSPEADRKMSIIKAQRELVKLQKEVEQLVNKAEVDDELFNFGKEIRTAFQSIPLRIVDQLLVLERRKAAKLMLDEINEVLLKLSKQ